MSDGDTGLLKAGTVLSHFVIDEMVGAGAMGQVWLGNDRRDNTRVAVKVLNAEFSRDPMFRQRFEREAHVATLLKSPYTVQTLAFGREQGHYYIVMEFVDGESVEAMLANGPLPLDEALEIATDTARALEAAATQKIVHRDLKPSNIIVSPDGAAKLVDFGIASQGSTRDASAGFMGTVQYAAPEQQKGEADDRTDIYALGATLFHMLAGRPPFTGRTAEEILNQHTRSPFPAALLSLQPEPVVDIVRRAMQKDPQDRFQSAQELAAALDRVRSRLYQQRTEAPAVMPDQYRTMVPQPDDGSQSGATIVAGQRPVARTAPPEMSTEGTVVLGAPGRTTAPPPVAKAPVAEMASAATVVSGAAALGAAATMVSTPAGAKGGAASASVAAAPPLQPPSVPLRPRAQELPEEKGGGGRGKLLLIALVAIVLIGGAVGGVLALAGGGGDDKGSKPAGGDATATATKEASATPSASGTATGSATPTGSATTSTSATTSATAEATATETTAAPTATNTRPTGGQPTATPVPPTPVPPPPPTPTQAPASGTFSFLGFSTAPACGGTTVARVGTKDAAGATVSSSWTLNGASPGWGNAPQSVNADTVAVQFPTDTLVAGTYSFAALVGGRVVASGGFTVTC